MDLATTNAQQEAVSRLEQLETELEAVRQENTQLLAQRRELLAENLDLRHLKYQLEKHLSKAEAAIRIVAEATLQASELASQTLK